MKPIKSIIAAAAILSAVSCTSNKPLPLIPAENFRQSVDGKNVDLYTLKAGDLIRPTPSRRTIMTTPCTEVSKASTWLYGM